MRLGVVLDGRIVDRGGDALATTARRVEGLGFDLVWLRADDRLLDPFMSAPVVATATSGLRVGVEAVLGDRHPVLVAEAAAVADLAIGGRLVLGLRPAPGTDDGDDFTDAVRLVLRAHRPRPFRTEGGPWPTPANLDANRFMRDRSVRVTPAPAQPELPTWLADAPGTAARLGLSAVLTNLDAGEAFWTGLEGAVGPSTLRMSRPARVAVPTIDGRLDHETLLARLRTARTAWELDTVLFDLPTAEPGRLLDDLARIVRPRVQQEALPSGLVDWWDDELLAGDGPGGDGP